MYQTGINENSLAHFVVVQVEVQADESTKLGIVNRFDLTQVCQIEDRRLV
jgi:hypothetical protein